MMQLFSLLLLLLAAPLLYSFWLAGVDFLVSIPNPGALLWFIVGLLASILLGLIARGVLASFVQASTHELAHAVTGDAFAFQTTSIKAEADNVHGGSGETNMGGGLANPLIFLAPYSIPILTIPFLIAKPFVAHLGQGVNTGVDLMIGLTLGFHYVMHVKQFGSRQTDVQTVGIIPSIGFTYTIMLFFLILAVGVVTGSYDRLIEVAAITVRRTPEFYTTALDWTARAIDELARLL